MAQGRAESGATRSAPPPPSLLADAPRPEPAGALPPTPPEPPGARGDAPTGPGSGLRGSRSPRPAPRPPTSGTHGPLPRRYLAIPRRPLRRVGRRPGAARSPQSPGDWRRGGGGPGTTRRRRRRLASPLPAPGCSRRPRAWGGPLPSTSPGSRRRSQSLLEATLTATATAETLQPGLRRAGAVPARRLAGGNCCPGPAPRPAPPPAPRAPPPEAARAPPPDRPPAPPRASGARLRGRPWESEERGGARGWSAEGGASAESCVRRPISEGHGGAGEIEAARPLQILTEGRPSARRPCGEGEWPPNAVSPHCQHCIEDWKVWSRALAFPVKPHENQLLRLRNGGCRGEGRWLRFYELPKMRPGLGPCRSGHLPSRWCGAPSVQEGPRGHSDNILEPSSLASKAWWAYLCREETDPLMG